MQTFARKRRPMGRRRFASPTLSNQPNQSHCRKIRSIVRFPHTNGIQAVQRSMPVPGGGRGEGSPAVATQRYQRNPSRSSLILGRAAKLQHGIKLGVPGDQYERQADRVAEQVVGMPQPTGGGASSAVRSAGELGGAEPSTSSHGRPLDASERAFYEPRFGRDFSRVRIHQTSDADMAARMLGARAFALGSDIYFRSGIRIDSTEGRRTLAHELTHVVQQGAAAPLTGPERLSSAPRLAGGSSPVEGIQSMPQGPMIQRDCEEDQRKCRSILNWSDGGHWIGVGPKPDCSCDSRLTDAKAACRKRSNWSDGGHWIGLGSEPDCGLKRSKESRHTFIYQFPTNKCVQKFNDYRNSLATHSSTGAGIVTGALTARAGNAIVGIAAGAAVNELLGAVPQTPIGVGYRWERIMTARYTQSAHPWGMNRMTFELVSRVFDETNKLVQSDGLSYEVSRELMVRFGPLLVERPPNLRITIVCPSGDPLSY